MKERKRNGVLKQAIGNRSDVFVKQIYLLHSTRNHELELGSDEFGGIERNVRKSSGSNVIVVRNVMIGLISRKNAKFDGRSTGIGNNELGVHRDILADHRKSVEDEALDRATRSNDQLG